MFLNLRSYYFFFNWARKILLKNVFIIMIICNLSLDVFGSFIIFLYVCREIYSLSQIIN